MCWSVVFVIEQTSNTDQAVCMHMLVFTPDDHIQENLNILQPIPYKANANLYYIFDQNIWNQGIHCGYKMPTITIQYKIMKINFYKFKLKLTF